MDLNQLYKIVLTVLEGSSVRSQLDVLNRYEMDMEVCTPSISKTCSA